MGDPGEEAGSAGPDFHRLIGNLVAAYDSLRHHADSLEEENARLRRCCGSADVMAADVTAADAAAENGELSRPSQEDHEDQLLTRIDKSHPTFYNGEADRLPRSRWKQELHSEDEPSLGITWLDSQLVESITEAACAISEEDEEGGHKAGSKKLRSLGLKHSSSMLVLTPMERACSNWSRLASTALYAGERHHIRPIWDEDDGRNGSIHTLSSIHGLDESSSGSGGSDAGDVVIKAWSEVSKRTTPLSMSPRRSSRRNSIHSVEPLDLTRGYCSACCWLLGRIGEEFYPFLQQHMIHPYSTRRIMWVFVGILFMGSDILMLTLSVFGLDQDHSSMKALEIVAALYWSMDIVLSFFTGVYANNQVDMDLKHAVRHYLKTWFGFDAFMVAMQWVIIYFDAGESETGVLRYVRVLRYSRLLRLAKFEQLLTNILERINSLLVLLAIKMSMYLFGVVLYVHVTGSAWYWVGKNTEDGWVQALGDHDVLPLNYLVSVHWASAQLQGNVDIYPGLSAGERAFAVCHVLCSVVALASLVSKLTTVLHNMQEIKATKVRQVTSARRYLEDHAISTDLSMSVRKYVEWKQVVDAKRHHNTHESELLQILPRDLRRALLDETRSPLVLKHVAFVAFRNCNSRFFQRLCCDSLEPLSYMPDEHVFSYGMVCSRMYFMAAGDATYFKYGAILQALMHSGRKLIEGSTSGGGEYKDRLRNLRSESVGERSLCEAVIWVQWVHRGDLDTMSHVSILALDVKNLDDLVLSYPVVQVSMLAHARRFVAALNDTDELSDLFDSTEVLQDCVLG